VVKSEEKEEFLIQMRTDVPALQLLLTYANYPWRSIENYKNYLGNDGYAKRALCLYPCFG
jgi:hypothetical protein